MKYLDYVNCTKLNSYIRTTDAMINGHALQYVTLKFIIYSNYRSSRQANNSQNLPFCQQQQCSSECFHLTSFYVRYSGIMFQENPQNWMISFLQLSYTPSHSYPLILTFIPHTELSKSQKCIVVYLRQKLRLSLKME